MADATQTTGTTAPPPLAATALLAHVRALAGMIGPRPAGGRAELLARGYVKSALLDAGVTEPPEEQPFATPDTIGYALVYALGVALAGNLLSSLSRRRLRGAGGALSLLGAYAIYQTLAGRRQPLNTLPPAAPSANLIVRLPPTGKVRRRAVLLAHLDTNKHRLSFAPPARRLFRAAGSAGVTLTALNGLALLFGWRRARSLSLAALAGAVPLVTLDELGEFVPGANDNASGVACALGLAAQLTAEPLAQTEVWLAFTGAEEVGCVGLHALLDQHREALADAWFVNLSMVGAGDIAYITHHTGFTHFSAYEPDGESLAWAAETARANPQLGVRGKPMRAQDEVGALRARGFRGVCLTGVGADGWSVNGHQRADRLDGVEPRSLEQAARFAWAMLRTLDARR
jgi:hypothetical protein